VRDAFRRYPFRAVDAEAELHLRAPSVSTIVIFICTCSRGTKVGHRETDGRGCAGDREPVPMPPSVHRCVDSRLTVSASSFVFVRAATRRPTSFISPGGGAVGPCSALTPM